MVRPCELIDEIDDVAEAAPADVEDGAGVARAEMGGGRDAEEEEAEDDGDLEVWRPEVAHGTNDGDRGRRWTTGVVGVEERRTVGWMVADGWVLILPPNDPRTK